VNTLRKLCAVTILSLTLAGSALAGHMDTTGYVPPPPPPSASSSGNAAVFSDNTGGGYDVNATISTVLTVLSLIYP
jgi:hypothetical protein